jgi:hypothetical protein
MLNFSSPLTPTKQSPPPILISVLILLLSIFTQYLAVSF